ncbi:BamA/TamA family outer membrane protein [Dysgonomonas sp. Marseille-P4677]|uniref:translocation and assembly module lipoprotein TamL n=1 Tax=Dysgonomonas sp. Marseille-P4677 TaxID=2364790 RepID=UPI001913EED5|nr:BamA/TamA family outer membrane protein [Dysgonomonas sp. Marseille-P4677]MBK5721550.1 BamA/TamA family outer membrane protein [Dysgonomonas sp. Marseille-P4677]
MKKVTFIPFAFILILAACSTTKNIPEGSYLLDKFEIKHDTKNATSDLESFVRQQPNSSTPLLGKVRLKMYNLAGEDTSKWVNRFWKKIGKPPVLYNASQTMISANQLKKELNNQGYLDATVDTTLKINGKKIAVTYNLKGGTPYRIRNYTYAIGDTTMARIMGRIPLKPLLAKGDMFDMDMLEEERLFVNNVMRNVGYYNFSKEYVYFKADTTLNSHEVNLYLDIYPNRDSLPYPRYKLNKITVLSGIDPWSNTDITDENTVRRFSRRRDTTEYSGMTIVRGRNKFLRSSTIRRNNYLKPGSYYSDYNMTRTYEAFTKMGAIKQVNISTTPSPEDSTKLLDATINILPANAHWFKAGLDGTNSAGDIGIAPSVSYQHRNLFNGGEQLVIRLKGAYEFITGGESTDLMSQNYYEYGIETSLSVPQFVVPWLKKSWRELPSATTTFSIGLNYQNRVDYTRQFFNMTVNYGWSTNRNRIRHGLDLFDINYISMPEVSERFDSLYLSENSNPLLRESYMDQLVARTAYNVTFTNGRRLNALSPTYAIRTSLEVAGLLPRLATSFGGAKRDELGSKEILGVAYAEYIKGSVDYARTIYFSQKHSLAYHAVLGLAYPYGNSEILPFERRFFSGGSNSIRGWSTRTLGPGSYRSTRSGTDFVNQTGDMKLEFSIENRLKVSDMFEFAQFIDAGNIWTLFDYIDQPGGKFEFKNFYKEIAASYGIGLRLDLDFLLIRFDIGMKAYDPGLLQSDRFVLFKPRLNRTAFHFGIGYPF